MKKIVKGVLYDTETSELIYKDKDNRRTLYKSKKGSYWMLYKTGEIVPKTVEAVMDYLGEVDAEAYIREFGLPEEA